MIWPNCSAVPNIPLIVGEAKVKAVATSSCRKALNWFWIVVWIAGTGVSCAGAAKAVNVIRIRDRTTRSMTVSHSIHEILAALPVRARVP
jgi:hypothetical protein